MFSLEEDAEQVWTIDGATKKLEPSKEKDHWKTAFKEGVNLEEKILEENAWEKTHEEYEDYSSRYDLAFLTPCGYQVRFKVSEYIDLAKPNSGAPKE